MKKLVIFLILSIVIIGCSKENKVERVSVHIRDRSNRKPLNI